MTCMGSIFSLLQLVLLFPSTKGNGVVAVQPTPPLDLPLGDIQVVSLTDTHSWEGGHGRKEQQYDADIGDILSFVQYLKDRLAEQQRDVFFVSNGDFLDGTGLTQTGDPSHVAAIEEKMMYDALTIGNHDVYRSSDIQHFSQPQGFFDRWGSRFLTSNVVWTDTREPLGHRYRILEGQFHSKVLTFGFLYHMRDNSPQVTVLEVQDVVQTDWFLHALQTPDLDAVLVLAHMGADDELVQTILDGIRRVVGHDMPVQFLTGHTHKRRTNQPDASSSNVEGGCFLETVGFTSFPKRSTLQASLSEMNSSSSQNKTADLFRYKLIDSNRQVLGKILGERLVVKTREGREVTALIDNERRKLGLDDVVGCSDQRYHYHYPLRHTQSLWGLFDRKVIPLYFDNDSVLFLRYKHFRYDLLPGSLVRDEIIEMAPFNESLQVFANIPLVVILTLNQTMGEDFPEEHKGLPGYLCLPGGREDLANDRDRSYNLVTGMHEAPLVEKYLRSIDSGIGDYVPLNVTLQQIWMDFFQDDPLCQPSAAKAQSGALAFRINESSSAKYDERLCVRSDCLMEDEASFGYNSTMMLCLLLSIFLCCKVIQNIALPRRHDDDADMETLQGTRNAGRQGQPLSEQIEECNPFATCARYFCPNNRTLAEEGLKLSWAVVGIQAAYLLWGYLQELIMTTQFQSTERVPDGMFPSATFCVFSNRLMALLVAMAAVRCQHGTLFSQESAPLRAFFPCALSNTISSWSQYSALRYVSFPVVNVFKSCKIIPVMIMGYFVQGTHYPRSQYVEALLISVGVTLFSLQGDPSGTGDGREEENAGLVGLGILLLFITSDSFTSQWQSRIYDSYGRDNVDSYRMMLGVNTSAILITSVVLIASGDIPVIAEFLHANPDALRYTLMISMASTAGQLCIFFTIKEFGPIVFTIIMTTRQLFSICISSAVFGHTFSPEAVAGGVIVFAVLFYQVYRKLKARRAESAHEDKDEHEEDESVASSNPPKSLLSEYENSGDEEDEEKTKDDLFTIL